MEITHIGTQLIETSRLLLRRFEISDSDSAFRNWTADPDVQHNYGEPTYDTIEDTQELITKWIVAYTNDEFYRWAIILKESDECIGQIAFHVLDSRNCRVDVEYCIGKTFWGNGYASEALTAVIEFAFSKMGVNRVQGFHRSRNSASGKVMKKAGMKYEGTLRQYVNHKGEFDDCIMYGAIHNEWPSGVVC